MRMCTKPYKGQFTEMVIMIQPCLTMTANLPVTLQRFCNSGATNEYIFFMKSFRIPLIIKPTSHFPRGLHAFEWSEDPNTYGRVINAVLKLDSRIQETSIDIVVHFDIPCSFMCCSGTRQKKKTNGP